jgi:nitrate reductase NapE component
MTKNILKVFSILILISCHTVQTSILKPPEIQSFIEEIKSNPEIREMDKKRIISTLEISSQYNSECFDKNILLEKENFLLKDEILKLKLEIQTWRTIKKSLWIILGLTIISFFVFVTWKFRKLFGSPI